MSELPPNCEYFVVISHVIVMREIVRIIFYWSRHLFCVKEINLFHMSWRYLPLLICQPCLPYFLCSLDLSREERAHHFFCDFHVYVYEVKNKKTATIVSKRYRCLTCRTGFDLCTYNSYGFFVPTLSLGIGGCFGYYEYFYKMQEENTLLFCKYVNTKL